MNVFELFAKLSLDSSEYEEGLDSAESKGSSFGETAKKVATTVAGVGSAVGTAAVGVYNFASSVAESGDHIDKQSQKLGLSTSAYQEWDYVLNLAGTDMDSMGTGLKTLTNKLDDAKNGSEDAQAMFSQLGISMEDLDSMSREDLFAATIAGFQEMEDSTERAALANDLFGKSGQELTPLFNMTNEATQEAIQNLNDLGGVMSEDAVASSASFEDALTTMKATMGGATATIGAEFLPAITDMFTFVTDHSAEISTVISAVSEVLHNVISTVVGFISSNRDTIEGIIDGIVTVATTAVGVISGILDHVKSAIETVASAFGDSGVEMEDVWAGISSAIEVAGDLISGVIDVLAAAIAWLVTEAQTDGTLINTVWEDIQIAVSTVVDAVSGIIDGFIKLLNGDFSGAFESFGGVIDTVFNGAKDIVDTTFSWISDKVEGVVNSITSWWSGISFDLPHISMPNLVITPGEAPWGIGGFGYAPSIDIEWHAKAMNNAMLLDGATIFGAAGGQFLGGGEAGREIVAGESYLVDLIGATVSDAIEDRLDDIHALLNDYLPKLNSKQLRVDANSLASGISDQIDDYLGSNLRTAMRGYA